MNKIKLQSDRTLSTWHLSKSITHLSDVSMKLIQLKQMQLLYNQGFRDDNFIISRKSLDEYVDLKIFNRKIELGENIDYEYIKFSMKSNNAKYFWEKFHKLQRPMIFFITSDGKYKSLFDYENSIIFQEISVNSPNIYTIIGGIVIDIGLLIASQVLSNQSTQEILEISKNNHSEVIKRIDRLENNLSNQIVLNREKDEIIHKQNELIIRQNKVIINMIENKDIKDDIRYENFILNEKKKVEKQFLKNLEKTPLYITDYLISEK